MSNQFRLLGERAGVRVRHEEVHEQPRLRVRHLPERHLQQSPADLRAAAARMNGIKPRLSSVGTPPSMTWSQLQVAALLTLWLAACGRIDDSNKGPGSAAQSAGGSAGAGGSTGTGGQLTIDPTSEGDADQPPSYPPPFDAGTCPTPVATDFGGRVRCVTRAELADSTLPDVTLDGGVSALGPAEAWRCPQLNELAFSRGCGGEHCCEVAVCGPLTQRIAASDANDAGAAGDHDGGASEQSCCYYVEEWCGV